MTVDISKIKIGDIVTVTMTVIKPPAQYQDFLMAPGPEPSATSPYYYIPATSILTHTPKPQPIEVGDRVSNLNGSHGTVVWIDDEDVWVRYGVVRHGIYRLTDLELVS